MLKELKECPICQKSNLESYKKVKDFSISQEDFNISTCISCGFKFTNPIPTEETIGKYYQSEDYISHSDTNKGIINKLYHLVRKQSLKSKLQILNKFVSKKGTILDIGCGTGYFLQSCKTDGWKIKGMEPDTTARTLAEKNTNEKISTDLFNIQETESLEIITMWHVLEHVHKLNETVEHLHKLLKPKGILIIAVPNLKSYDSEYYGEHWAAYDVPRHLYHFSPKDINSLLTKHNFEQLDTLPMLFDSFYVSMLSDKYKYGKTNYIRAFWIGFMSNLKAMGKKNHSSLIYVFQKK